MSGADLMGNDYLFMWLMIGVGMAIILAALFAPSKTGTGNGFQSTGVSNPLPESLSGLAGKPEKKTYTFKTTAKFTIPPGSAPAQKQVNESPPEAADNNNIGVTQMDSAVPFVPGGPEALKKAPAASSVYSKYGFDVMDEGYRLFIANPDTAAAQLADKFGSLTVGEAKDVIAKADALDYTADDEADNVTSGLYPADKAAINLMKTNPGFSEALYSEIMQSKVRG
jgi:hypothetical protein